jgi:uncharacterized protein (TIGR02266 family)
MIKPVGRDNETRESARYEAAFRVRYQTLDHLVIAYSRDLSKGGMFLRTDRLLPLNAVVRLHIELPEGAAEIPVICRVIHVRDHEEATRTGEPVGIGIQFLDLGQDSLNEINRFISERSLLEASRQPAATSRRPLHVLVVDDSPAERDAITTMLRDRGDDVREAMNGLEALSMCLSEPPDVILSDVQMPEMDGWQLLRVVRTRPSLSSIPVIFITSLAGEEDRLRGYQLGVDDYIGKPYRAEEVRARVDRLVVSAEQGRGAHIARKTLRGSLEHVSLASILGFLELERKTGVLLLVRDRAARLYLRDGRPLRVEVERMTGSVKPRQALFHLLGWTSGQFEFAPQEVVCEDELLASATALVLDYARLTDDARREQPE